MKIRYCFVSNSSSSSYICVIRKETYEELIKKASDFIKKIVSLGGFPEEKRVNDDDLFIITGDTRDRWYLNNKSLNYAISKSKDKYITTNLVPKAEDAWVMTINNQKKGVGVVIEELRDLLKEHSLFFHKVDGLH